MKTYLEKYNWENVFYFLAAVIVMGSFNTLGTNALQIQNADWMFPFNFFPISSTSAFHLAVASIFFAWLLMALFPSRFSAYLAPLIACSYLSLLYSFGVIHHSRHGLFLISLGIAVSALFKKRDRSLDFALAALCYIYTSSGLWKLRELVASTDFFEGLERNLPTHIAAGVAENYDPQRLGYLKVLNEHPGLSAWIWAFVIGFQILIPLGIVFLKEGRVFFLISLCVFHAISDNLMGIPFPIQSEVLRVFIGILIFRWATDQGWSFLPRRKYEFGN